MMNRRELLVQITGLVVSTTLPKPSTAEPIPEWSKEDHRYAEAIKKWGKPYGRSSTRKLQRHINDFGGVLQNSSAEHKSCLDCEHVRVGGMPNRACVRRPLVHIWFVDAGAEVLDFGSTVEGGFRPNVGGADEFGCVTTSHPGKTMADVCPFFQLDAAFQGNPVVNVNELL